MADAPVGPPTIIARKQAFLAAQTNLLSQPLTISATWARANDASNQPIHQRLLDDAMFRLNHKIQQHSTRVYAPLASRNVAEQIGSVYMRDVDKRREDAESGIGKEVDLLDPETITALPESWPLGREAAANPVAAGSYDGWVKRLMDVSGKHQKAKKRLESLRQLQASVSQLGADSDDDDEQDQATLQENLATRNGPVEKELERMRSLLLRVSASVEAVQKEDLVAPERPETKESRKRALDEFLNDKAFT